MEALVEGGAPRGKGAIHSDRDRPSPTDMEKKCLASSLSGPTSPGVALTHRSYGLDTVHHSVDCGHRWVAVLVRGEMRPVEKE